MSNGGLFLGGSPGLHWPENVPITREAVEATFQLKPRKVHFPTTHSRALKRDPDGRRVGTFGIPFYKTVGFLFERETHIDLLQSKYGGYWYPINSNGEFDAVASWIQQQGTTVFIRDTLGLSIALDFNFREAQEYTAIGDLENRAKNLRDRPAIKSLAKICVQVIAGKPCYREVRHIAAVPPRPGKAFDLPSVLADLIAMQLGFMDITPNFQWTVDKGALKSTRVADKWDRLDEAGLILKDVDLGGAPVILLDDLYQSGRTMQFVGMTLQDNGAGPICGLALVKSWRDTDNF